MSKQVILYDMPCKSGEGCWSPNVWKTRLVLNYKNIPYRTSHLTHPEITPKLKSLYATLPSQPPPPPRPPKNSVLPAPNPSGLSPNAPGPHSDYTVPAITLPDGTSYMESSVIATELERLHPQPTLHLSNGLHAQVGPILGKAIGPLIPVFMPRIGRDIIVDSCHDWFQEARAQRFGMPLEQLEREKGGARAWEAAKPGFAELKAFMVAHKRDEGPFVLGSEVCYADFLVCSMVESLRRIGMDLYDKTMGVYDGEELRELHTACAQWLKEDK